MNSMTTIKNFSLTSSQFAFVQAVRPHLARFGLTEGRAGVHINFSTLRLASIEAGYSAVPAWCMSAERKYTRGFYKIPELFANDSAITVTATKRGRKAGSKNSNSSPRVEAPVAPVVSVFATAPTAVATDSHVSLVAGITDSDAESFVPTVDENYVPWGYHSEIKEIIKKRIFAPVFITGLSGNGKTTMVEQACAQLKRECVRVNFTAESDEDTLIGGFRLINGETKFVPGPVLVAMERGAILLLDEVDLGGHLIMCLQSVLEGKGKFIPKIGKYVRPAVGFNVLATANTKGRGDSEGRFVGTNIMNEAFLERFDFTYEQDYASTTIETRILKKYAESLGVNDDAFCVNLVNWADIIRKSFKVGAVTDIITTRRLLHILKAHAIFNNKAKAIERCITRFDQSTKEAFLQMYTKVDAEVTIATETDTAVDTNKAPF